MRWLRGRGARRLVAVAAAYALVLKLVIAGVAGGVAAAPSFLTLCTSFGIAGVPGAPDEPARHHDVPDCCLSGCPALGAPAALPQTIEIRVPAAVAVFRPHVAAPAVGVGNEHTPHAPRGPPPAA